MRNLIHVLKDGNEWCAIYPIGSNIMDCQAVEFAPEDFRENTITGKIRDCGGRAALSNLRVNNPDIKCGFYSEFMPL